ncbi:MAG: DUF3618 domain-containing protein [Nocardioidaceae bacterium]
MANAPQAGDTPSSNGKPDDLVDEIEKVREHLATTVDALVDRVSPKNVARRTLAGVKAKFVDEKGSPRLETIVPVVGGTVLFVGVVLVIRKLVND